MRDAGRLAAEVLTETGLRVKPGVSTLELNDFAHKLTIKRGAESAPLNYKGFPKSICTSVNDVVCHGIPRKDHVLKDGDIINLDITVKLNGYHGDTSRTFAVGKVSDEARKLMEDTEKSMWIGIDVVKPGNRISDIGDAIDKYLTPRGYGIVRELLGHGIGRGFHEDPQVPHYKQSQVRVQIKPGMTFTVEPMVNCGTHEVEFSDEDGWTVTTKDGRLSAQYEHTILVTEEGHDVLTLPV
ncbi:MAG: type I methionyl aminopeptidase [Spirochaetia bacterium]|nr:type I methionyl aminopeptidase [Spirochaetia bacterium]